MALFEIKFSARPRVTCKDCGVVAPGDRVSGTSGVFHDAASAIDFIRHIETLRGGCSVMPVGWVSYLDGLQCPACQTTTTTTTTTTTQE